MQPSPSFLTVGLKKLLFRRTTKHPRLQPLWRWLHTLSIFGMNYGGGGAIETSGELFVLGKVAAPALFGIPSPVVFDVGANTGEYSLQIMSYLPGARIFAFEPGLSAYTELTRRVAGTEHTGLIETHNIGFSDTERTAALHSYKIEGREVSPLSSIDLRLPTQVIEVERHSTEQIKVTTLDTFCSRQKIDHIDLLKIDVEGHELAVLNGARGLLDQGLISMIQFEFGSANIYSRTYFYDFWSLLAGDFEIYRLIPSGIVPIPFYGEHREIFLTSNYLAIRKRKS
jgi:FkbM family methyltransferase